MLAINPYLSFNGSCEAAFNFYKAIFGGEFEGFFRYKEAPDEYTIPESDKEKILHVSLPLTKQVTLMGADASEAFGQKVTFGNYIAISICTENEEETTRIFNALSAGGTVTMPLAKTFWADLYGMCIDQFGISWIVNFVENPK